MDLGFDPSSGIPEGLDPSLLMPGQQPVMRKQDLPDFKNGDWCSLYPIYVNADLSMRKGRRLPIELCYRHPMADEMYLVVKNIIQLPCVLEQGVAHPRDSITHIGRLRVKIKNNGVVANPLYSNKIALLKKCAEEVPKLDLYQKRDQLIAEKREEYEKKIAAAAPKPAPATTSSATTNNKKKGKKKH